MQSKRPFVGTLDPGRPEEETTKNLLAYTRFGEKENPASHPLIILHGLFGSKRNWKGTAEKLSSIIGAEVYTVDLPHHGESPGKSPDEPPDEAAGQVPFSLDAFAEEVCRFMEARIEGPAVLMGHSLGGRTAVKCTLKCPERVAKLILVDISPFDLPAAICKEMRRITDTLIALDLHRIESRRQAEQQLLEKIPDVRTVRFLLQNMVKNPDSEGGKYQWRLGIEAISRELENICTSVLPEGDDAGEIDGARGINGAGATVAKIPLLCIRGGKSPYFPLSHLERLKTVFPGLEEATIPGAGHWLHIEKQDEFLRLVGAFY